jgi:HEPN domain-containing protein
MPHRGDLGTPEEWLARARSNLAYAKITKPDDVSWEDVCFNLQQAAEKALKAVLLQRGIPFPFTHVIGRLVRLVVEHGTSWPEGLERIDDLTDFAVVMRYPGSPEPVTEDDFAHCLPLAERVVAWAEEVLQDASG